MEYLKDFLDKNVLIAHAVHLTKSEIKILKEKNVKISHNPVSNLKLSSGIAPIPELLKNDILVSLGTDGTASNNSLNIFEDLKIMALIHKLKDPKNLDANESLKIATENGGKALNLKIGKIEEGYLADLIFIDLKSASLNPEHNLISNVVYSMDTESIKDVMIDGKFVMQNRKILTLDEEKIIEKTDKIAKELVNR